MSVIEFLSGATAARTAPVDRDPIRIDVPERGNRATTDQFAQILALLAGTSPRTRLEMLRQVPAEGASLLDRLLTDPNVVGGEGMTEGNEFAGDAASALRYGLLKRGNEDNSELAVAVQARRTTLTSKPNDPLSRASRKGVSLEELLAVGDVRAAEMKQTLDALLSHAGQLNANASENDPIVAAALSMASFANALADARALSASDVTTPVKHSEALAPELRERLARVVERMKSEFGHDVTIVETARSPERQDYLFEQGRSRPGTVVTWTRDSAHMHGFAADVVVDDSWDNPQGYARLQRIAREEGLHTLGMRDPGHLELPHDLRGTALQAAAARASSLPQQKVVADAAQNNAQGVARVAGVAQVATVARVGMGAPEPTPAPLSNATITSLETPTESLMQQQGDSTSERRESSRDDRATELDEFALPVIGPRQDSAPPSASNNTPRVESTAFQRALDVQQARDASPARAVSQLTLQVDAPNGGSDEITIGMRGKVVDTQIVTDANTADRLRSHTGELQSALGRHGLEADSVRISSAGRQELQDAARGLAANSERDAVRAATVSNANNSDSQSQQQQSRERAGNARDWQERQEAQREREEQRQSSDARRRYSPFNPQS